MCIVKAMDTYLSKLHPECDLFFQRPNPNGKNPNIWYCKKGMSENALSKFMPTMSHLCNLSRHYTNHDIRATGIAFLTRLKVPETVIMSTSGHKSKSSLGIYQKVSEKDKLLVATALQQGKQKKI